MDSKQKDNLEAQTDDNLEAQTDDNLEAQTDDNLEAQTDDNLEAQTDDNLEAQTDDNLELLFQDFWKRISNLLKILKKKDIKNLYKDRPLTKLELDFLYKKYNDKILSCLHESDDNLSIYNPDNYRTPEESMIARKKAHTDVREAYAAGVIHKCMSPIERIRAVIKHRDSICCICKAKTSFLCSKCKTVKYCGSICQKLDWKNHKKNCI